MRSVESILPIVSHLFLSVILCNVSPVLTMTNKLLLEKLFKKQYQIATLIESIL